MPSEQGETEMQTDTNDRRVGYILGQARPVRSYEYDDDEWGRHKIDHVTSRHVMSDVDVNSDLSSDYNCIHTVRAYIPFI